MENEAETHNELQIVEKVGESNASTDSTTNNSEFESGSKKRKMVKERSIAWRYFNKFTDAEGVKKAKCKYCSEEYVADTKHSDINNLLLHMPKCPTNPYKEEGSQTTLGFQPKDLTGDVSVIPWKFDQETCRRALARMIIKDELPFISVEKDGFRDFVRTFQPLFHITSHTTMTRDCLEIQKGQDLASGIAKCLLEWGVDKVFTLTVNNTSSNDVMVRELSKQFTRWNTNLIEGPLLSSDWDSVRRIVKFLEIFYELTLKVSGTLYITSNVHFLEMCVVDSSLKELMQNEDAFLREIAKNIKEKFDKFENTKGCDTLFNVYTMKNGGNGSCPSSPSSLSSPSSPSSSSLLSKFILDLKKHKKCDGFNSKMELDKYLGEDVEEDHEKFNILGWWKLNSPRFPTLAEMARDVLAISISSVASGSTFSTDGRILDPFRSSLTPRLVQALVCVQDWLRNESTTPVKIEEDLDNLKQLEAGRRASRWARAPIPAFRQSGVATGFVHIAAITKPAQSITSSHPPTLSSSSQPSAAPVVETPASPVLHLIDESSPSDEDLVSRKGRVVDMGNGVTRAVDSPRDDHGSTIAIVESDAILPEMSLSAGVGERSPLPEVGDGI
ncbi:zinc finger BED domain-containing protein DAYSLEEPER-like [Nicotiana sylvestris]|uniref:zinc finger BED domain-containing protein DAYSLEEPER-like n=1 Tax=Nicotiana sylvestris TaxID=4096 RepID=UPI00388CC80F